MILFDIVLTHQIKSIKITISYIINTPSDTTSATNMDQQDFTYLQLVHGRVHLVVHVLCHGGLNTGGVVVKQRVHRLLLLLLLRQQQRQLQQVPRHLKHE